MIRAALSLSLSTKRANSGCVIFIGSPPCLDFCLPFRPRHLVSWPAAFQIMIKNNAESSSFDLLRNVFRERFQSNIPCTLAFSAV
jgi:hypothetical protein